MPPGKTKLAVFGLGVIMLTASTAAVGIGSMMGPVITLGYGLVVWFLAVGVTVHEHSKSWKRTLNPRLASWAYLADPFLAVAGAAFVLARPAEMVSGWVWLLVWTVAIVVAGASPLVVRFLDRPRYRRYKAEHAFDAAGKTVHDFLTASFLAGINVALSGWALLEGRFNTWFWIGTGCVAVWALGLAKDSIKKWEPNPLNQYPIAKEVKAA